MIRQCATAVFVLSLTLSSGASAQPPGQFSGNPAAELLPGGRQLRLLQPFSYTDPRGRTWIAPSGTVVDGASIPRAFWTVIGGPLEGSYRNASIIHDHYCVTKSKPWQEVHRVFYDGMISAGVGRQLAALMYFAVFKFGPRWETRVTRVPVRSFSGPPRMVSQETIVDIAPEPYDAAAVETAIARISQGVQEPEAIEALAGAGIVPGAVSADPAP
jgi:hypothetical protein